MTDHNDEAVADCTRHFADNRTGMYYARRCMHLGNRFVVEIRSRESNFVIVDYVEDVTAGGVLVEAYDPSLESVDDVWEQLSAKLMAGAGPVKH